MEVVRASEVVRGVIQYFLAPSLANLCTHLLMRMVEWWRDVNFIFIFELNTHQKIGDLLLQLFIQKWIVSANVNNLFFFVLFFFNKTFWVNFVGKFNPTAVIYFPNVILWAQHPLIINWHMYEGARISSDLFHSFIQT